MGTPGQSLCTANSSADEGLGHEQSPVNVLLVLHPAHSAGYDSYAPKKFLHPVTSSAKTPLHVYKHRPSVQIPGPSGPAPHARLHMPQCATLSSMRTHLPSHKLSPVKHPCTYGPDPDEPPLPPPPVPPVAGERSEQAPIPSTNPVIHIQRTEGKTVMPSNVS